MNNLIQGKDKPFYRKLTDKIIVDLGFVPDQKGGKYERYQFKFIFNLFDFEHIKNGSYSKE